MMLCCAPLLYKWLISHLAEDITIVEEMSGHKWDQYLVSLTGKNIIWYPQILHRINMILICGNFPNVPLIGSKGCITYNPTLANRQFGYPLVYKPDDKLLEGFVLQGVTMKDPTILKVIHSWKKIKQGRSSLKRPRDEPAIS